jgi:endonuclease YncB( thermonuclease family)
MTSAAKNAWIDASMRVAVRVRRVLLFTAAVLVHCVLSTTLVHGAEVSGTVLRIADGDTILLLTTDGRRQSIRIAGIDAPEPAQPFGRESRAYLARLVAAGEVRAECPQTDRRGSIVCKVWARPTDCPTCAQTVDIGLAQIAGGMAWWYRRYGLDQSAADRARYESEEQAARSNTRGLWVDAKPVPPWDWRRGQ